MLCCALFIALSYVFSVFAAPGQMKTSCTLVWDYPTNSYSITNGTDIETFTNDVEQFVIYSHTDPAVNTASWPIWTTVPGTNRSLSILMSPQLRFFVITAKNYWGESRPSNVAGVPSPPRSDMNLRIQ